MSFILTWHNLIPLISQCFRYQTVYNLKITWYQFLTIPTGVWSHKIVDSLELYCHTLKSNKKSKQRIDTQQWMDGILQDTHEKALGALLQRIGKLFVLQVHLSFILKAFSHQPLKLQCFRQCEIWSHHGCNSLLFQTAVCLARPPITTLAAN